MKKLLTRFIGATLGLAMAMGICVGVGNMRDAKAVKADPASTTYEFGTVAEQTWTSGTRTYNSCDSSSGLNWTISNASNVGSFNSSNYKGIQIGTSKKTGSITLTSASAWGVQANTDFTDYTVITKVELFLNGGGDGVASWSATIGGASMSSSGSQVKNSSATAWNNGTSKITLTPTTKNTGVFSFTVEKPDASKAAAYFCGFIVYCREEEQIQTSDTTTSLSVSPNNWSGYDSSTLNVSDFTVTCTTTAADDGYVFQGIGYMVDETFVSRVADFSSGHPTASDTRLCWKAKYPTTENGSTFLYVYVALTVTEDSISSVALSNDMTKLTYTTADSWSSAGLVVTGTHLSGSSSNVTENTTFKYYCDSAMTNEVAKPINLGVGERIVYVKATCSGVSNEIGYPQIVTIEPCVAFVGGTDKGTANGDGQSDELTKNDVTLASDSCYTSGGAYRFYSKSNITISSEAGNIGRIEFNMSGGSYVANTISLKAGSPGSYNSDDSSKGIWSGNASSISFNVPGNSQTRCVSIVIIFSQTASNIINNTLTRSTLSYRYSKEADTLSYQKVALRFGGSIDAKIWDRLDRESTIIGYGLLLATGDLADSEIQEWYSLARNGNDVNNVDEALAKLCGSELGDYNIAENYYKTVASKTPTIVDGSYGWNLYLGIDNPTNSDFTTSYTAVAYIRTSLDELIFFNEVSKSAAELAYDLAHGTTFDEDNNLQGSMNHLADLYVPE